MNECNSNTKRLHTKMSCAAKAGGDIFVEGFHYLALFCHRGHHRVGSRFSFRSNG